MHDDDNKFDKPSKYDFIEKITEEPEFCKVVIEGEPCGHQIVTMAYKGTGACGENHRKLKTKDYEGTPSEDSYGRA